MAALTLRSELLEVVKKSACLSSCVNGIGAVHDEINVRTAKARVTYDNQGYIFGAVVILECL